MFQAPKLTNAGKALYYDNMAGAQLKFTTIKLGSGTLSGSIANLTNLVNTVVTIDATATKYEDYANVAGSFSNAQLAEGFYWREIGVFAADPSDPDNRAADILYCYQNAYDTADYIPVASVETVEKNITVPVIVGDVTAVSCTLSKSLVFVTQQDLEDQKGGANGLASLDANGKITPAQVDYLLKSIVAAADYDPAATYAAGAYCTKAGTLYKCTTPITAPEAWTVAHWAATTFAAELLAIITSSVLYRIMTLEQLNSPAPYSYNTIAPSFVGFGPRTDYWSVQYFRYEDSGGYGVQTITCVSGGGVSDRWYRTFLGGSASEWRSLSYRPLRYDVDYNTLTQDGIHQIQYYSAGCPNSPIGAMYCHFFVQVFHHADNWIVQIAHQVNGSGTYTRNCFDNVWQPWRKLTTDEPPQIYDIPIADGWTAKSSSKYWKDQFGQVSLTLRVGKTTPPTIEGVVGCLPAGFRPSHVVHAGATEYPAKTAALLVIETNGNIEFFSATSDSSNEGSFCGAVSFVAGN